VLARVVLALIGLYQETVSGRAGYRQCRFRPTCSHYACQAISRYGALTGGLLAWRRVARCNPRHAAGDDPVP
jgi:putative membrane protein insertion efficiency factor